MLRQQAVSKASKFLGRKHDIKTGSTAKQIKQRARDNPDLNRAALNQIVADIYQRGSTPKDLDLERIDFSVSFNNIRSQVKDLLDKRGNEKFANRRRADRESEMAYAKEKESEQLITVANVRHERRPHHNQYVDETKEANKKFGRLTDSSYQKWARNPNKYDIEGVDGKEEKGSQMPLPLKREQKTRDYRLREIEIDTSESSEVAYKNDAGIYRDLKASKSSETLDNFQDSVEKGGKQVSEKFDGNYT